MKIVINTKHGGFEISKVAANWMAEKGHQLAAKTNLSRDIDRSDPLLVQSVEKFGDEASDRYARLEIIEIPDGVEWQIESEGGREWIAEKHRTWGNGEREVDEK